MLSLVVEKYVADKVTSMNETDTAMNMCCRNFSRRAGSKQDPAACFTLDEGIFATGYVVSEEQWRDLVYESHE